MSGSQHYMLCLALTHFHRYVVKKSVQVGQGAASVIWNAAMLEMLNSDSLNEKRDAIKFTMILGAWDVAPN